MGGSRRKSRKGDGGRQVRRCVSGTNKADSKHPVSVRRNHPRMPQIDTHSLKYHKEENGQAPFKNQASATASSIKCAWAAALASPQTWRQTPGYTNRQQRRRETTHFKPIQAKALWLSLFLARLDGLWQKSHLLHPRQAGSTDKSNLPFMAGTQRETEKGAMPRWPKSLKCFYHFFPKLRVRGLEVGHKPDSGESVNSKAVVWTNWLPGWLAEQIKTPLKQKAWWQRWRRGMRAEFKKKKRKANIQGEKEMQTKQRRVTETEGNKRISIWLVRRKLKWGLSQEKQANSTLTILFMRDLTYCIIK